MEFTKQVNWQTHTDGKGYWTTFEKTVTILEVELAYVNTYVNDDGEFGELRARFDTKTWNCDENGLIYTDPQWIDEFRGLMRSLGFSRRACDDITYSEQGMQGYNFVSMDVGEEFMREVEPMHRWLINKESINA
jgi:hypothetical protein